MEEISIKVWSLTYISYSAYIEVKVCPYILQVTLIFTCACAIIFTISTTTSQPSFKAVETLQGCKHLAQIATTLQGF